MSLEKYISIVIPNYNNAATIGKCLKAAFTSRYKNFEVIVVDDKSEDDSVDIIKQFPSKLISLEEHGGASKARNVGAQNSRGETIFFTDADCLLNEDTLLIANKTLLATAPDVIIGGTYTRVPYDKGFFSRFQSVYVNFTETKEIENPDYIPAHAMLINAETFRESKGFPEDFMPIIEDIEFSHRLQREGCRLVMNPGIQVRHIFNFSLAGSMRNAIKKVRYWTMYSLKNKDTFTNSGAASIELKVDVCSYFLSLFFFALWISSQKFFFLFPIPLIFAFNIFINRKLIKAFYETGGPFFAGLASLYYIMLYPLPVGTGVIAGMVNFLLNRGKLK